MEQIKTKKTVFVGVSGGVDSSVSAALLLDQGYDVVGVFIRTWTPDFIECTWRDERRDAMRVCAHLGIPFLECDAEEMYKKGVADYMIEEYKKGNTPNPDVMCNREVKFGVFWDFARAHGADYIATGHYAIVAPCQGGDAEGRGGVLKKSPDTSKDQSYFLWTLTHEDLEHTLFPIGHLEKSKVRKLAEKYKLPTATKKDSQGVCFLGPLDMKDFLKHYIVSEQGDVLNESGEVIGHHDGAVFFTLGERHGFTIDKHSTNDVPYYVVAKDIEKNTITVAHLIPLLTDPVGDCTQSGLALRGVVINSLNHHPALSGTPPPKGGEKYKIQIKNTNWISDIPEERKNYKAQFRYHGEEFSCTVKITGEKSAEVIFENPILVSPGQSIVLYDENICLGGGVVVQ